MAGIDQASLFNYVPDEKIHFNKYDKSFDNVLTTEAGRNVVSLCRRVIPGETCRISVDTFGRTLNLQAPIYGKFDVYNYAFFVRTGSVSTQWEKYIKGGDDGKLDIEPDLLVVEGDEGFIYSDVLQELTGTKNYPFTGEDVDVNRPFGTHGSLSDYLSIGSCGAEETCYVKNFKYSLLPFKAYQSIWCEYFADANIQEFDGINTITFDWLKPISQIKVSSNGVTYSVDEGHVKQYDDIDVVKNLLCNRHRCYAKDYFTSSLPEPQRGIDVLIPVDANIDIMNKAFDGEPHTFVYPHSDNSVLGINNSDPILYNGVWDRNDDKFYSGQEVNIYNADNLRAQITSLSSTITDLRRAVALQEMYESQARYGSRYKEFIYGNFGSMIPDDQLVRPWYLGGTKQPLQISEVVQTAPDSDGSGVGSLFGKALTSGDGFLFERTFDDYGVIMVITSIRPRNYYVNSVKREFTVTDRLDEYNRKLQAIGEQSVQKYELGGFFYDTRDILPTLNDTFGYQMRFSEYKFANDEVHGDFKGSLSDWTIARDFRKSKAISLNEDFLVVNPKDINHIFQYTGADVDHFLLNMHFDVEETLPMDIYSIPRIN